MKSQIMFSGLRLVLDEDRCLNAGADLLFGVAESGELRLSPFVNARAVAGIALTTIKEDIPDWSSSQTAPSRLSGSRLLLCCRRI
jgi:hypothetical protein